MERLCNTGLHFHPPPPSPALRSSRYSDRSLTGRSAGRSRVGSGQGHPCSSCWEGTAHPRCRTAPETGCPSRRRGSGPDNRATNRQTTGIANRHHFRNGGGRSCSDRHASCPGDGGSGGKVGWLHAPLLDSAPPPPHTHTLGSPTALRAHPLITVPVPQDSHRGSRVVQGVVTPKGPPHEGRSQRARAFAVVRACECVGVPSVRVHASL